MEARLRCVYVSPEYQAHTYELSAPNIGLQTFEVDEFDCREFRASHEDVAVEIAKDILAGFGITDIKIKVI